MLGYLSLDLICSSKLTVFLELRSRKTVRFSEQRAYFRAKWRLMFIYTPEDLLVLSLLVELLYSFENEYQVWKLWSRNFRSGSTTYLSRCIPFQGQLSTMDSVLSWCVCMISGHSKVGSFHPQLGCWIRCSQYLIVLLSSWKRDLLKIYYQWIIFELSVLIKFDVKNYYRNKVA